MPVGTILTIQYSSKSLASHLEHRTTTTAARITFILFAIVDFVTALGKTFLQEVALLITIRELSGNGGIVAANRSPTNDTRHTYAFSATAREKNVMVEPASRVASECRKPRLVPVTSARIDKIV